MTKFQKELEVLINKNSMENGSNTPDYILAEYLCSCLQAFEVALNIREKNHEKILYQTRKEEVVSGPMMEKLG